jgi:hypothetical protein
MEQKIDADYEKYLKYKRKYLELKMMGGRHHLEDSFTKMHMVL